MAEMGTETLEQKYALLNEYINVKKHPQLAEIIIRNWSSFLELVALGPEYEFSFLHTVFYKEIQVTDAVWQWLVKFEKVAFSVFGRPPEGSHLEVIMNSVRITAEGIVKGNRIVTWEELAKGLYLMMEIIAKHVPPKPSEKIREYLFSIRNFLSPYFRTHMLSPNIEYELRLPFIQECTFVAKMMCATYCFFAEMEWCFFLKFAENIVGIVKKENIDIIYSIDRSGRVIGWFIFCVLSELGLARKIKCYFIHGTTEGQVTMYDKRQEQELKGRNVLLLDEFIAKGTTIEAVKKTLWWYVGAEGKIIPAALSSKKKGYFEVTSDLPSWYEKKQYSGMTEKPHGGVEINEGAREIARSVRKALSDLGKIVAEYLRACGI
jgi:hypoxanthine phosphoribosyltransferase